MLSRSTGRTSLARTKCLSILAITGVVIAATFLHADSDEQSNHNTLAGTWMSLEFGGTSIVSFMSDGRSIFTGAINIATGNGPGGMDELASPAPGEWMRTGNREFSSTSFSVLSSPPVNSAHLVKLNNTWKLNKTSDELTGTSAMISVFLPDGTLQFGPFPGSIVHFKRVIAGQ